MSKSSIVIIAAIITVIGGIFVTYLAQTGFFTKSDIRFQQQPYTDNVCASMLGTSSGAFDIYFSNRNGKRGTDLYVALQSPNNISFIKSSDAINIPAGLSTKLTFTIDSSSLKKGRQGLMDNVSIQIIAKYSVNNMGKLRTIERTCNYTKTNNLLLLTN